MKQLNTYDADKYKVHDESTQSKSVAGELQVIELLTELLIEIRRGNVIAEISSRQKRYWTAEEIALQIGKSKSTVQSSYTCKPDFPPARRLPANKGKGHPVWLASEVLSWIEKHKER